MLQLYPPCICHAYVRNNQIVLFFLLHYVDLLSDLNYCLCIVCGSARGFYVQMLDPVQNHALRLCLGDYQTSPSSSLSVLENEPPLYIRRRKLSIQYSLKLS